MKRLDHLHLDDQKINLEILKKVKKKEKEKEGSCKFEGVNCKEHSVSVLTFLSF